MTQEAWHGAVLRATKAKSAKQIAIIQTLWSGYGEIVRVALSGTDIPSCIVKYIRPMTDNDHPRGWNTDFGHQRKLKSYEIESYWYDNWAQRCDDSCRVPNVYAVEHIEGKTMLVLEDVDASGYPLRYSTLKPNQSLSCIRWLAYFHALFVNEQPEGLWSVGSYWHLATRPDEFKAMLAGPIKDAAITLDKILNKCRYQTVIHGDAKLANFCFSKNGNGIAAVDFQYVGGGCGMKDLAYFIGSCLDAKQCHDYEAQLLDYYFYELRSALRHYDKHIDADKLELEWRELYAIAWTDFTRFLLGWMPNHRKLNSYTKAKADQALQQIEGTINY